MPFDNNYVSGASLTTNTYTGAAQNWFGGGPIDGAWMRVIVSQVIGNPNVVFRVSVLLADGVTWVPVAYDPQGPCNVVGVRVLRFIEGMYAGSSTGAASPTQYRLEALPNELPNGGGSGNSSSLSSQSFASSSSGGSQYMAFSYGIVPSISG